MRVNIKNYKILKSINKKLSTLDEILLSVDKKEQGYNKLSVAVFHTAVLAIIALAISSYFLFYSQIANNMVNKVIINAEKINKIRFADSLYFPDVLDYQKYKKIDATTISHYAQEIFAYLFVEDMDGKNDKVLGLDKDSIFVPNDLAERAEKALKLLNMVLHCYPFPKSIFPSGELFHSQLSEAKLIDYFTTHTKLGWGITPPIPLIFSNFGELNTWFKDIENVCKEFYYRFYSAVHDRKFSLFRIKCLKALAERKKEDIQKYEENLNILYSSNPIDPMYIFNDFMTKFEEVVNLVNTLKVQIVKVKLFREKIPKKNLIIIFLVLSFIAFLTGAIIPLFLPIENKFIQLQLPAVLYTIFLSYILWNIIMTIYIF